MPAELVAVDRLLPTHDIGAWLRRRSDDANSRIDRHSAGYKGGFGERGDRHRPGSRGGRRHAG